MEEEDMQNFLSAWIILFLVLLPSFGFALECKLEQASINRLAGNVCEVKGSVRNFENRSVAGYVQIQLMNNDNDILTTHTAYVNDGNPLLPKQAGPFKFYMKAKECKGATKVGVIFRESAAHR
jgi:hypothetical protein